MGVWIETRKRLLQLDGYQVTPFVGVWIETIYVCVCVYLIYVTPFVGVWIETHINAKTC